MTCEPGSAVPATVRVPLALGVVVVPAGAAGGVVSVTVLVVTGDVFPAGSVAATMTGPAPWGAVEVAV